MIDSFEDQINSGIISVERGRNCDYCSIQKECDARTVAALNPRKGVQLDLFYPNPFTRKIKKTGELKMFSVREKKKKVKPPARQLTFRFPREKN